MLIRNTLASIGRLAEFRTGQQKLGDRKRSAKMRGRKKGRGRIGGASLGGALIDGGRTGAKYGALIRGGLGATAGVVKGSTSPGDIGQRSGNALISGGIGGATGAARGFVDGAVIGGAIGVGHHLATKIISERFKRRRSR